MLPAACGYYSSETNKGVAPTMGNEVHTNSAGYGNRRCWWVASQTGCDCTFGPRYAVAAFTQSEVCQQLHRVVKGWIACLPGV